MTIGVDRLKKFRLQAWALFQRFGKKFYLNEFSKYDRQVYEEEQKRDNIGSA